MSAIERYTDDAQITGMTRYAKAYSGSGFFKDAASVEKAFVVISAGAEIGIAPFASITGIALIQGKPVIGSGLLAGLVKAHPRYDYEVTRLDDEACELTFFQDGKKAGVSSFTMADAKRAKLDGKDVWRNYPRNMLFARAISNGVAFYAPDVTTTRVYVEGELDDLPVQQTRPIASPRNSQPVDFASTDIEDGELTIEAEIVEDAVAVPEQAASATPVQRTKAALASLSDDEREAVYEACDRLGVKRTVGAIVLRFGTDAYTRETLLPALAAAVNPPDTIEGEITAPMTAEEIAAARQFEAERDADGFGHDKTAEDIDGANARRDELSARLAAAGSFGES